MTVTWTEGGKAATLEYAASTYPTEFDPDDFDKAYEGTVIGSTRSFWGFVYLTVACTDGKIREVSIDDAEIVKK